MLHRRPSRTDWTGIDHRADSGKEPPESLAHIWQLAEAILSPATEVIVFGFAFNPYDKAVLRLLRACSVNTRTVQLINTSPKPDRATAIWTGAEIVCKQPP